MARPQKTPEKKQRRTRGKAPPIPIQLGPLSRLSDLLDVWRIIFRMSVSGEIDRQDGVALIRMLKEGRQLMEAVKWEDIEARLRGCEQANAAHYGSERAEGVSLQ